MPDTTPGYTTADLAARWRVSPDKVRAWIERGELAAVNTSMTACAKPRFVVTPDALAAFERRRSAGPPPKRPRRRRRNQEIDYYPD